MRTQKDKNGEVLNIAPKFLLVPAALEDRALQMINSTAPFGTETAGSLTRITNYWILSSIPALMISAKNNGTCFPHRERNIQVAYLDGNDEPYLEQQEGLSSTVWPGKSVLMLVWPLWIIAVWSNQAVPIHYDNKAAPAAFFAVPGGVGMNTGRAAAKKRIFFILSSSSSCA